jgi:hypothetical protein
VAALQVGAFAFRRVRITSLKAGHYSGGRRRITRRVANDHAFALHVFLATQTIAPTTPNIIEKGVAAWGITPRFLLPKPIAYPRPNPTPMQPRMMTTLSIFHFAPRPVVMANPVPNNNGTNQSAAMNTSYLPAS